MSCFGAPLNHFNHMWERCTSDRVRKQKAIVGAHNKAMFGICLCFDMMHVRSTKLGERVAVKLKNVSLALFDISRRRKISHGKEYARNLRGSDRLRQMGSMHQVYSSR